MNAIFKRVSRQRRVLGIETYLESIFKQNIYFRNVNKLQGVPSMNHWRVPPRDD